MITLARENFRDLSIGSISKWPYGAEGEYHVMPDSAYTGSWEEANITYAWRSGSGCWKVISEDGRRVMEQTMFIETDTPLLVTGSRFWDDYVASVDIRPLSWKRPFGLVVRYVHSRRYYLFALFQNHVAFILRDHEREVILGTAPWQGGVDRYYRVSVACEGERLAASIDDRPILKVTDGFIRRGRIGLLAETQARFAEVEVTTDEVSGARISAAEAAWKAEEEKLQSANPAPLVWKRFETKGYGTETTPLPW